MPRQARLDMPGTFHDVMIICLEGIPNEGGGCDLTIRHMAGNIGQMAQPEIGEAKV